MQKQEGLGQHSLHDFKEIIRQVRECKTAAQERELLNKEKALIRERFLQGKEDTRAKDVAKLLYIAMLGHNTDFGQMECLKLISSQNFGNKRVGYLGLCQLFHENSEVLMLATNHIHLDLSHSNNYVVSLAIVALSEICTAEMCRELLPDLLKQFAQGSTFVKKKAALCCVKMAKLLPEATADIVAGIDSLMEDKHHGVLLSTVTLMRSLILENEENKNYFYKHITPLKKILKALISNMSAEFDVNGVNDPFLQILILDFFRMMAIGKQHVADEISGILGEVATNTNSDKNSGCAVLYECVKTVMEIGSTSSLKILCLNVLGKFLKSTEPNIKYASLFMIQKVLVYDIKTVQKYMSTILACLKEEDLSIKQLSLDLIYMVSSPNNVEAIVKELLNHMMDLEQLSFLPELILQTCAIVDKFAPNRRWHIDTVIKVLSLAGNHAKEDTTNNLINLISVSPNLQQYATNKLFYSLKAKREQKGLAIVALYCIGEFGQKLVSGEGKEDSPSQKEVFELIKETFEKFPENDDVKEYGMACLMKLVPKFRELQQSQFESLFSSLSTSTSPEVQKRACEYLHVIQSEWKGQLEYVFQATPQFAKAATQFQGKPDDGQVQINKVNNLLEDPEDSTKNQSESQQQNLLDDLLGAPSNTAPSQAGNSSSAPIARDLLSELMGEPAKPQGNLNEAPKKVNLLTDLLGDDIPENKPAKSNISSTQAQNLSSNIIDLLGDDDEINSTPKYQQKSAEPNYEQHVFVPIEDNNIRVVFKCFKAVDGVVEMNVQFGNKTNSVLSDLVFQVAVQKQNKLTMNPVSSTSIPPLSTSDTTQVLKVVNSMAGQKPLQLKVRLSYSINGIPVSIDSIIQDFPKTW